MVSGRATAELVVGSGLAAAMTIGYIVYASRTIGAAESSDFFAALSVIYIVGVALSPLTPTIARLTTRCRAAAGPGAVAALRSVALGRVLIFTGAVTFVGACASLLLAHTFHFRSAVPLILAFAAVLVYAIVSVDRGVLQGLFLLRTYNANVIAEAAVRLVVAAALLLFMRAASAALLAYVAGLAVSELLIIAPLVRTWRGAARERVQWKDVERLAVPMFVLMCALAAFQNTDMLAVKRWLPPHDAGAYGAAMTLARGIGVIFVPFYVVAGPMLTALHDSGKSVLRPTIRLTGWFLAAAIVPLAVLAAVSPLLVATLYGPDFLSAAAIAAPLAGVTAITYAGVMLAQALVTLHDFRFLIGYGIFAVVQVAGLALFHATFRDVLYVLYASQGAALLSVCASFLLAWKVRR